MTAMQCGTHLLAVLWESAWTLGQGEDQDAAITLTPEQAMAICAKESFVPSLAIDEIGSALQRPTD